MLLGRAAQTAGHAIDEYDDGRGAPAKGDQPFDQPLLGNERGHQDGVQIESLAEHPRVVGQQEVVQSDVQDHAAHLRSQRHAEIGTGVESQLDIRQVGPLTGLWCSSSVFGMTRRYQTSQSELLAAKEANRFMCSVMRAHFRDLGNRKTNMQMNYFGREFVVIFCRQKIASLTIDQFAFG